MAHKAPDKMLEKLQRSVEAGNFYDAQQMYKSAHSRLLSQRKANDAANLVLSGAVAQLKQGQVHCGVELAELLVEDFQAAEEPWSPESCAKIMQIVEVFPRQDEASGEAEDPVVTKARVQGYSRVLKAAIRWSAACGGPPDGAPELHSALANYVWTQSNSAELAVLSRHFLRSNNQRAFAVAVAEVMEGVEPKEVDLLVVRAVLQYLALQKLPEAQAFFTAVQERWRQVKPDSAAFNSPIAHFATFLLIALDRQSKELTKKLVSHYRASLQRDNTFQDCVEEILFKYFNVPKQQKGGMQGILGDLFQMLSSD